MKRRINEWRRKAIISPGTSFRFFIFSCAIALHGISMKFGKGNNHKGVIPRSIVYFYHTLFDGIYALRIHFTFQYAWNHRHRYRESLSATVSRYLSQWPRKLTQPRAPSIYIQYVHTWNSSLRIPLYLLPHWIHKLL